MAFCTTSGWILRCKTFSFSFRRMYDPKEASRGVCSPLMLWCINLTRRCKCCLETSPCLLKKVPRKTDGLGWGKLPVAGAQPQTQRSHTAHFCFCCCRCEHHATVFLSQHSRRPTKRPHGKQGGRGTHVQESNGLANLITNRRYFEKLNWIEFIKPFFKLPTVFTLFFFWFNRIFFLNLRYHFISREEQWVVTECLIPNSMPLFKELLFSECHHLSLPVLKSYCWHLSSDLTCHHALILTLHQPTCLLVVSSSELLICMFLLLAMVFHP